jgi:hypothetical protein
VPFSYYERLNATRRRIYDRSDALVELPLPPGPDTAPVMAAIAASLAADRETGVQRACQRLLDDLTARFAVPPLRVKVYATRPSGDWGELHGMYLPEDDGRRAVVELWMRTAQKQQVVAPRTFLRTLLHELCHHLDYELYRLEETFHTEGFYKRESHLLHQLAGPPEPKRPQPSPGRPKRAGPPGGETEGLSGGTSPQPSPGRPKRAGPPGGETEGLSGGNSPQPGGTSSVRTRTGTRGARAQRSS